MFRTARVKLNKRGDRRGMHGNHAKGPANGRYGCTTGHPSTQKQRDAARAWMLRYNAKTGYDEQCAEGFRTFAKLGRDHYVWMGKMGSAKRLTLQWMKKYG
jgi:hypothetical protein